MLILLRTVSAARKDTYWVSLVSVWIKIWLNSLSDLICLSLNSVNKPDQSVKILIVCSKTMNLTTLLNINLSKKVQQSWKDMSHFLTKKTRDKLLRISLTTLKVVHILLDIKFSQPQSHMMDKLTTLKRKMKTIVELKDGLLLSPSSVVSLALSLLSLSSAVLSRNVNRTKLKVLLTMKMAIHTLVKIPKWI